MRNMRSVSVSVIRTSDGLFNESLLKSTISLKSMFSTTISKTKVLLRVLLSRTTGRSVNSWQSVSSDFKTRIISQTTDSRIKQTSNLNKFINQLLNGHKILINRLVLRCSQTKVFPKVITIGSSGLSLGLVGVCVRRDGPTLISETDLMEVECQTIRNIFNPYRELEFGSKLLDTKELSLDNIEFGSCIAKGCNGVVYSAQLKSGRNISDEWFAVKMLFNFEAESNAIDVWNALNKECVPFAGDFAQIDQSRNKRQKLVSHPNIVSILGVFVDRTPQLEGALHLYPDALPVRMGGYARNMTLFMVEKRYDMSLKQYLASRDVPTHTSLVMLTQLLEAISFLVRSHITHRDLKTDNILLSLNPNSDIPWLVVTDFGFCLTSLSLPFNSDEVCRGGNRALMAPEIIVPKSGPFVRLDYSCSDVWAVGAIAYEIFNGLNPFYPYPQRQGYLQSISYKESELPEPPESMPPLIQTLVLSFLCRNPNKRTEVTTGVNVCQMLLHMSPTLVHQLVEIGFESERIDRLFNWLKTLSMTTLSKRKTQFNSQTLTDIEFKLRLLFLSQVKIHHLKSALDFVANSLK